MVALEAIVSGVGYIVLAFFLGILVAAGFLLPAGEPKKLRETMIASALAFLLAFLVVSALSLLIQGAKLQRGAMPSADLLLRYVTMAQSGRVWLLREIYGAALALTALRLLRREASLKGVRLIVFLALPLLASRSFTSHAVAVSDSTTLVVAADAAHLIATGLWGGGLLALFAVLYRGTRQLELPLSWAAQTVVRFSRLALASVAIILLTGLYQSWIHVGGLGTLFATDYGRVLLLKFALFLAMLGLGALNLLSTRPRLLQAARQNKEELAAARKALIRIGAESFFGLMVFSLTGLLTVLPPGVHAVHQAALTNASPGATHGNPSATQLQPAEGASVKILSPTAEQVFASSQVPLRFKLAKGKRGHHVHAYVDNELMGMFDSEKGTLNGIKPGAHVLKLRVAAEDHQTELDASDQVRFMVK